MREAIILNYYNGNLAIHNVFDIFHGNSTFSLTNCTDKLVIDKLCILVYVNLLQYMAINMRVIIVMS